MEEIAKNDIIDNANKKGKEIFTGKNDKQDDDNDRIEEGDEFSLCKSNPMHQSTPNNMGTILNIIL